MERDGNKKSIWQDTLVYSPANIADLKKVYDVVIVGAGITGITTALLLQTQGKNCLLIEAYTIGFGTTGGTTAHLNTFFDTPYSKVIKNFGEEKAKLLASGAKEARALIKNNVTNYKIDCDYMELDGYLFSINESQDNELDDIVQSAKKVNVDAGFTNNTPFPIPYLKLASFGNQAQFNPISYISTLAKKFEQLGGVILEDHRVLDIMPFEQELLIRTEQATIKSKSAIYATHIPPGVNFLQFRCAPYRSYSIAVKLNEEYPMALGYDMNDPYHYYRTQKVNGEMYLIAGGEDHKTGHEENTDACFRRLESHVRSYFDVASVKYKWSSQYFETVDGLPYIGTLPGNNENIYTATGFGGNGMIYGTLSGIILSQIIINGKSVYQDLFAPNRIKPIAGFTNFIKEGADAVASFIKGKLNGEDLKRIADLAAGEAKIIKLNGHHLAMYKDESHGLHVLNAVCTHYKCTVSWNVAEKTWDCPCHGARYSIDGVVLNGPANVNLEKINWLKDAEITIPN